MSQPTFMCPKCKTGELSAPDEKNNVICQNAACRRRWRLLPDRSAIMGAATVLKVDSVKQASKATTIGGKK